MFPIVTIDSPEALQRGRQYGEQAQEQIESSLSYYRSLSEAEGWDWQALTQQAAEQAPGLRSRAPEIMEEIQGISQSTGISLSDLLMLNMRGELIYAARQASAEECTSFAAFGEDYAFMGQNWDFRTGTAPSVVILRIRQGSRPTITTVVEAGQVGRHGCNSSGVALFANGLPAVEQKDGGLPQTFLRRMILNQSNVADAVGLAARRPIAIPANLVIGSREGFALDAEVTPSRFDYAYPTDGVLTHANHFENGAHWRGSSYSGSTFVRKERMAHALSEVRPSSGKPEVRAAIEAGLTDHTGAPDGVCSHADPLVHELRRAETLGSLILDLKTGDFHIARGNPCAAEYRTLSWNVFEQ